jgi:phosphoglycerol transferase MdoB-like AlkP superfamily enzyme
MALVKIMDQYLFLFIVFLLVFWLIPATVLTIKVMKIKKIEPSFKKQLILPMWFVPLIGNFVCYFIFSRTGELNRLSAEEHRRIW